MNSYFNLYYALLAWVQLYLNTIMISIYDQILNTEPSIQMTLATNSLLANVLSLNPVLISIDPIHNDYMVYNVIDYNEQ